VVRVASPDTPASAAAASSETSAPPALLSPPAMTRPRASSSRMSLVAPSSPANTGGRSAAAAAAAGGDGRRADAGGGASGRPLVAVVSPPIAEAFAASAPARPEQAFGLSGREREVLALIVEGRTNREIGERLFISQKTVGVHVGNILAKLGVSGRVEAAMVPVRLDLVPQPMTSPGAGRLAAAPASGA